MFKLSVGLHKLGGKLVHRELRETLRLEGGLNRSIMDQRRWIILVDPPLLVLFEGGIFFANIHMKLIQVRNDVFSTAFHVI